MSATEWKFVPVEPTIEMVAALGFDGDVDMTIGHGAISAEIVSAYTNMLDAAPVPPSVESLLENWTPSDQQAFARFRDEHFPGEMDSYAIQSLGSAWKDGQANAAPSAKKICRDDGRCEYAIQTGAENEGSCPAGACAMPCDNSAAHLTIPGALEWDGDNGTHGADGESRADGESAQPVAYIDLHSKTMFPSNESVEKYLLPGRVATPLYAHADPAEVSRLRALLECSQGDMRQADQIMARQRVELDNLEQSRRSFFDLSQDLEKRLAERDALLRSTSARLWNAHIALNRLIELEPKHKVKLLTDTIHTVAYAHKCIDMPRYEASAEPAKPKTCIECDQPYCHGVCVERGDQDYDRDQAEKGGVDE